MNSKGMFYTNVSDYETKEDMMNDFIALRMYDMAKDKEIERLNKEIKEYQEELEKADSITQSCIFEGKEEATKSYRECLNLLERLNNDIKELLKENGNKEKVIKSQDNIIKEVREYIINNYLVEEVFDYVNDKVSVSDKKAHRELLEILDKVGDEK